MAFKKSFTSIPKVNIRRSTFHIPFNHKTTFNTGELVPFYVHEILPGDTFKVATTFVLRMSTPLNPIMDRIAVDFNYFYVPNRIIYDKWAEVMGQNDDSAWIQSVEPTTPILKLNIPPNEDYSSTGVTHAASSIAKYMGIPLVHNQPHFWVPLTINPLPFRAYVKIYNDWYRNQNIQAPIFNPLGFRVDEPNLDTDVDFTDYRNAHLGLSKLLRSNKFPDYFTTALPSPQKGPRVLIPFSSMAPVVTQDTEHIGTANAPYSDLKWKSAISGLTSDSTQPLYRSATTTPSQTNRTITPSTDSVTIANPVSVVPSNLYANVQNASASIEELRKALAVQSFYETDARGGTRYTEILLSHFGISAPDAELQRPIFLGGHREDVIISQVLSQTSNENSAIGETGAFSLTVKSQPSFEKSFTEHGFVIGIATVRHLQTYQYGLEKFWTRTRKLDYYWEEFAHLGEMAVLTDELYTAYDHEAYENEPRVFGYQEAWADYRYKPSVVSGAFASNYPRGSLDSWHLAEDFEETPILNEQFIQQGYETIDRVISQTAELSNQWICDILVDVYATRPLPVYSIPGISNKL